MCSKYKSTTYQPKLVITAFNEILFYTIKDRLPSITGHKNVILFSSTFACWYLCLHTREVLMKIMSMLTIYYLKAQLRSKYDWFRAKQSSGE